MELMASIDRLSHERLLNLIIYVLMDQAIMTSEWVKDNPDDEDTAKMHDAILLMREKPTYMCEIEDWIVNHLDYLDTPTDCLDPHYYEMIVDAMGIIYYDDFADMDGGAYAFDCEKKYSRYVNNKED